MEMKPAVLVIDMLNDFVTGELKCDTAQEIIPNISTLLNAARKYDWPVVYCNDAHLQCDSELKKWGPHAMKGTKGAEVIPEFKPTSKDYIIEKRTYSWDSAFVEINGKTPLGDEILRKLEEVGMFSEGGE